MPKKGHVCPIVLSDDESESGLYVPTSPPYSPTSPSYSPTAPPYLPTARRTPTPPVCTTSDEEEEKPLVRRKQIPQETKTNSKRKRAVIDDDDEDEEEEEDARALLLKAARLLEKKQTSDVAASEEKDDEIARLKKMLDETEKKLKAEKEAGAKIAYKFVLKTKEVDALQDIVQQQQGQVTKQSTQDLWQIHEAIIQKIRSCYKTAYEKVQRLQASATPSTTSKECWVVVLDTGAEFPLPDVAQEAIEKAITQTWFADDTVVVKDAYSQTLNGQKHVYSLRCVQMPWGMSPMQINQETKKERVLSKKTAASSAAKGDPAITMNEFVMPLVGYGSKFIFQDEYEEMMKLPCDDTMYTGDSPVLEDMADEFLRPFIAGRCVSGSTIGWCRPSLLFHFLSTAKNAFDNDKSSKCFFWAHGTRKDDTIRNDLFGMNMRFSNSGNAKGKGVYVACNPYVPMEWANRYYNGKLVLGVAITHNGDPLMERYRMDAGVTIRGEPNNWKSLDVKHAIVLKNSQLNAAIPLGVIPTPR